MELNHIILNNNLIAELYSSSLIEEEGISESSLLPPKTKEEKKQTEQFEFKHLGSNAKNILIVVHYTETAFLPDEHLSFLTKIISACKISLADVAIINQHSYQGVSFNEIMEHFKSKTILLFGVLPKELGMPIQFPFYQVQNFNHSTFLSTPELKDLIHNDQEKRKLWECMKAIFSI